MPVVCNAAGAGGRRFPGGAFTAHFRNVRDFGAVGDGVADDTAALRRAIDACLGRRVTLYLPDGVYRVTGPLDWRHGDRPGQPWDCWLALQGQSEAGTVIRLDDRSADFQDTGHPRALLKTGDLRGETGGEGYGNNLWDLTLDVGRGNAGARGVFWHANNWSSVRRVTIRAGDGGEIGFYGDCGPASVERLTVEGFGVGVAAVGAATSWDHVNLRGQRDAGFAVAAGSIAAVRRLDSDNVCPAIVLRPTHPTRDVALLCLTDSTLRGGDANNAAVDVGETATVLQRVETSGYGDLIRQPGVSVPGGGVRGYVTDPPYTLGGATAVAAEFDGGPVPDVPDFHDDDLDHWVSVADFGAVCGDGRDDSAAIQAALDFAAANGKTTVYFPPGEGWYNLNRNVTVRGGVRRLAGLGSQVRCQNDAGDSAFKDATSPAAWFRLEHAGDLLLVDYFHMEYNAPALSAGLIPFDHVSRGRVVLRDVYLGLQYLRPYRAADGAGDLFVDLCFSSGWRFDAPQHVYLRAVNPESPFENPQVVNSAADLWMFGVKTEYGSTVARTEGEGRTVALGFGAVQVGVESYPKPSSPAFEVAGDGRLAASALFPQPAYNFLHRHAAAVAVEAGGATQTLGFDVLPRCSPTGRGRMDLFVAGPTTRPAGEAIQTGYRCVAADAFDDGGTARWKTAGGRWEVASPLGTYWSPQLAQSDDAAAEATATFDAEPGPNFLAEARLTRRGAGGAVALLAGLSEDAGSCYALALLDGGWSLSRTRDGRTSEMARGDRRFAVDRATTCRLTVRGGRITAEARDQEGDVFEKLAEVTDPAGPSPAGKVAVRTCGAAAAFDDVTVRGLLP